MRFIVVTRDYSGLGFTVRLDREGHKVILAANPDPAHVSDSAARGTAGFRRNPSRSLMWSLSVGEAMQASGEPGDRPDAPYRREHILATNLERLSAAELDVDWFQDETYVDSLRMKKLTWRPCRS
jgi:hypothetical protein